MKSVAMAAMMLFSGENLDDWIPSSGDWAIRDGSMVCRKVPGSIRTAWEADVFALGFRYRGSENGENRVAIHSKMMTGGHAFRLTPAGVLPLNGEWATDQALPDGQWITARIEVQDGRARISSFDQSEKLLTRFEWLVGGESRGFLRFDITEPGLEIRDVEVAEPGFVHMFDGQSLDGWEAVRAKNPDDPGWIVEDGVIRCRGHRSSWLRTWRTYDNFVLRLEFNLPPQGNSGIFLRAPIEGRVSREGLEIQIVDDVADRGKIKPWHHTGSVYDAIAPEVRVPTPVNQWNAIEIHLQGRRIRTTLNGIQIYDASLDDPTIDHSSDVRPLTTRKVVGFIGLQDHSTVVRFRHVRIRELPAPTHEGNSTAAPAQPPNVN